jgi:hypothetical protein
MVFLMSLSPLEDQLRNVQIKNKLILRFFSHEDRLLSREIISMSPWNHEMAISFESLMVVFIGILAKWIQDWTPE